MTRSTRAAVVLVAVVAIAVVAAQLVLPGIAERRIRHRLERVGTVERVEVKAFPAVKLLWHRADRVNIRMRSVHAGTGKLGDLLAGARGAGRLDYRADEARILSLRLTAARVRKRGHALTGEASVADADLAAALPPGLSVRPVASGAGELLLEGRANLLGIQVGGLARVAAVGGRLVITPVVPFGGLVALTLFAEDRVEVQGVEATRAQDGFLFGARGRLR